MRKHLMIFLLFTGSLYPAETDSLTLQIFPGMDSYKIKHIAVLDRNYALAVWEKGILKWDGQNWSELKPSIPVKSIHESIIKIFSPKNIWLFYSTHGRIYHTEIVHFNGQVWEPIPSPQPYLLKNVSFLDSMRFLAAGQRGSLIYFDGKLSANIKAPQNVEIRITAAFARDHFLGVLQLQQNPKEEVFFEYRNKQWKLIDRFENHLNYLVLKGTSEPGFMINERGIVSIVKDGAVTPVDTVKELIGKDKYILYRKKIYVAIDGAIYSYLPRRLKKITEIGIPAAIYPLAEDEFLLTDMNYNLYYLGLRQVGRTFTARSAKFFIHVFKDMDMSGHLSAALYPNINGTADIYFTNPDKANVFYTNKEQVKTGGLGELEDISVERRLFGYRGERDERVRVWDAGVFFADIDNDGDLDAALAALQGKSLLYENTGGDRFRNVTESYNFELRGRINNIVWGDLNGDGNLDFAAGDERGSLKIFLGDGFFQFKNMAGLSGLPDTLFSYMPALADLDDDGDLDILLYTNADRIRLFENLVEPRQENRWEFIDRSGQSPGLTEPFDYFTQSVAFGDYDNDGDFDLFLANRRSPLKLFRNDGDFNFADVSKRAGIDKRFFAYGGNWGDLDQDGYLDLFVTTLGKNYIFWNRQGKYFDIDSLSLPGNELSYSCGSALQDLDRDGDLDIVIANYYIGNSAIYENFLSGKPPLEIMVRGSRGNRFGIGARLWVYDAGHGGDPEYLRGSRFITTNAGYNSGCLPMATFALPPDKSYDVEALFPAGERLNLMNIAPGQQITISQPATFATRSVMMARWAGSWFLHPGKRLITIRLMVFALMLLIPLIYLLRRSSWLPAQIAFFIIAGVSSLAILLTVFDIYSQLLIIVWLYAALLGCLFTGIYYYVEQRRKNNDPYHLYDLLRQFKHGKSGLQQAERLMFVCNNLAHSKSSKGMMEKAGQEAHCFREDTAPLLWEMIEFVRRANLPASHYYKLKKLSKQVIRQSHRFDHSGRIPSPNKLRKFAGMLRFFKRQINDVSYRVERLISCNLIKVLNDSLNQFSGFTSVSLNYPPDIDGLMTVIRRDILVQVLTNIFQNALEAMKKQSSKTVNIIVKAPTVNEVFLAILDNGPGIPGEIQNQIFQEGFSTKNSTGLGLYHSAKLLRQWGGAIELIDASPHKGACYKIKLKVTAQPIKHTKNSASFI